MTQKKRVWTERLKPELDALDPVLSPEASAMLHLPAAIMSTAWQETQTCADPGCLGCRIGRAMAWTTKACQDVNHTLDVLSAVVDLVPRDPALGPHFQKDLAFVSLHEMERVLGELRYWGKNLGYACGLKPVDETSDEIGVAVGTDHEGGVIASVIRRQRPPEGDEGREGKVN